MRKIQLFLCILAVLVIVLSFSGCTKSDFAVNKAEEVSLADEAYSLLESITANYPNRTIGSEASETFLTYLNNELISYGYEVTEQSFTSKKTKITKNVIAKKTKEESKGKIVLGANWDNMYEYFDSHPDGAYQSGASIATLLAIAKYISTKELIYDVEIVFFAGSSENWNGTQVYVDKLSEKQIEEIKLFVNFGYLAGGDNLYIYSRDNNVSYDSFIREVVSQNNVQGITKTPTFKNIFEATISDNQLYSYSHIGMFGNNVIFMNKQIPSIHFFSMNWSDLSNPICTEIKGMQNVLETSNDTLDNMKNRVSQEKIVSTLDSTIKSTIYTIVDNQEGLINVLQDRGEVVPFFYSNTAYYIFNGVIKILCIAAILLIVVYCKNYISKNKEVYAKLRVEPAGFKVNLEKLKDGSITPEELEDIFKAEEEKLKGVQNKKEDNSSKSSKDDDIISDDDVFQ